MGGSTILANKNSQIEYSGFIHSIENIEQFSAEWQTLARIMPLYCLMILPWWQTGQGRCVGSIHKPSAQPTVPPGDSETAAGAF
jgi:hypothetical protein